MWKNTKCFYSPIPQYFQKTYDKQILTILRLKPVEHCAVKYQNTTATAKHRPQLLTKAPPVKYVRPPNLNVPEKENKISPSEWALLIIPIATFCLGTWQVQRRQWKLNIIERLESRLNEPPIDLPEDLMDVIELEYRKVKVKGTFDHSGEIYFGPRSLIVNGESASASGLITAGGPQTAGHHVITPFILSDSGKRILVDRGWVPTKSLLPSKRPEGQIEGEVELVGVVRLHENRGTFVAENKPHLKVYHYRDLKRMGKNTDSLPILIDASVESSVPGGPIGGQTNVGIRNEHMSYIITWYSLTAIVTGLWVMKVFFR